VSGDKRYYAKAGGLVVFNIATLGGGAYVSTGVNTVRGVVLVGAGMGAVDAGGTALLGVGADRWIEGENYSRTVLQDGTYVISQTALGALLGSIGGRFSAQAKKIKLQKGQMTEADYLRRIQMLEKNFGTGNVHSLEKHGAQTTGLAQYRRVQQPSYPNPTTGAPGNPTKTASKFLTYRDHYRALRRALVNGPRTGDFNVSFNHDIGFSVQNLGTHANRGPYSASYSNSAVIKFDSATRKFYTAHPVP